MSARGEYSKTEGRRQLVIDAAMKVFAEAGFEGSTIRTIAREANMAHTSVLRLFETKIKLYEAVLADRERQVRDDFDREGTPAIEMLRNLVLLAGRNQSNRGLTELYSMMSAEASSPEHPAHEYFVAHYRGIRVRLTRLFTELQAQELLGTSIEPHQLAASTIAHFDGIQLQWLIEPEAVDLVEYTRRFFEAQLNEIGRAKFRDSFKSDEIGSR